MSKAVISNHETHGPTYASYLVGFVLSVILTTAIFFLVQQYGADGHQTIPHDLVAPLIAATAVAQAVIQLVCFLHLGREGRPRWKLLVFGFMLGTVVIVVFGSLWIMDNLNYNMIMSPEAQQTYNQSQDGL